MEIKLNTTTREIKETIGQEDKGKTSDQIDAERMSALIAAIVISIKKMAHNEIQEDKMIEITTRQIKHLVKAGQYIEKTALKDLS